MSLTLILDSFLSQRRLSFCSYRGYRRLSDWFSMTLWLWEGSGASHLQLSVGHSNCYCYFNMQHFNLWPLTSCSGSRQEHEHPEAGPALPHSPLPPSLPLFYCPPLMWDWMSPWQQNKQMITSPQQFRALNPETGRRERGETEEKRQRTDR